MSPLWTDTMDLLHNPMIPLAFFRRNSLSVWFASHLFIMRDSSGPALLRAVPYVMRF